jgi:hypothetical protein
VLSTAIQVIAGVATHATAVRERPASIVAAADHVVPFVSTATQCVVVGHETDVRVRVLSIVTGVPQDPLYLIPLPAVSTAQHNDDEAHETELTLWVASICDSDQVPDDSWAARPFIDPVVPRSTAMHVPGAVHEMP